MRTAYFVLSSETAWLPRTTVLSLPGRPSLRFICSGSLETAARRQGSPGGPLVLKRAQVAAAAPPTSEDHAARQVSAQRRVAGLLARPAPRAQTALDRAHASEPWPVSHVSAGAGAAKRHHGAPHLRIASRRPALAGTSGAARLCGAPAEWTECGTRAQPASQHLLRARLHYGAP